ncbi:hypothetical protein CAEBREN_20135 [Caenorhabditis brenneri]|uniref:Uncharacterized protein n=1 Tax=Caenorhabditis brenneri TaxID=135651 RepID=G0N1K1_CAEBE|nr:hypothetical protein CAEBREN_20135 [Caenorhabditis brenneri]
MLLVYVLFCLVAVSAGWFDDLFSTKAPEIIGVPCSENQVILSMYNHLGKSYEFKCGSIPCGEFGRDCVDDQIQCRTEHDYFLSGMRWAPNNESLLLRCCKLQTKKKTIYVGTEELGSYYRNYHGGGKVVAEKRYEKNGGTEYDFIANFRSEGHFSSKTARTWTYRIMCENEEEPTTAAPAPINSVVEEERASGEASGEEMAYED